MNSNTTKAALLVAAAAITLNLPVRVGAAEPRVINYRNGGTGAFPDADPPLEWSNGSSNILWSWEAPVFDNANSSPIIVGDRIFTLTGPLGLVCLDKQAGLSSPSATPRQAKELWRRESHATSTETNAYAIEQWAKHHDRLRKLQLMAVVPWETWTETHLQKMIAGYKGELARLGTNAPAVMTQWVGSLERLEADVKQNGERYKAEVKQLQESLPAEVYPGSKLDGKKGAGWPCAAAPVSDGQRVYAIFHPGLVVCYDLAGNRQWVHVVTTPEGRVPGMMWSIGAQTPVAVDGKLLVQQGDELQCLEAATGKLLWRRYLRDTASAAGPAVGRGGDGEYYYAMPHYRNGSEIGRISDGEVVFKGPIRDGYFPVTVSPDGSMFHFIEYAVRLPKEKGGTCERLGWTLPEEYISVKGEQSTLTRGTSMFCPAVWAGDRLFWFNTAGKFRDVSRGGVLAVFDPFTGKMLREPNKDDGVRPVQYPPMLVAGKYVFVTDNGGTTWVFTADVEFKRVGQNTLALGYGKGAYVPLGLRENHPITEGNLGPVFEGKRMYFRTLTHLYCIGKNDKQTTDR